MIYTKMPGPIFSKETRKAAVTERPFRATSHLRIPLKPLVLVLCVSSNYSYCYQKYLKDTNQYTLGIFKKWYVVPPELLQTIFSSRPTATHQVSSSIFTPVNTSNLQASLDNIAFILATLTAGGGITGYVRTGSIPSVAAGVTVGALVSLRHHHPSCCSPPLLLPAQLPPLGVLLCSHHRLTRTKYGLGGLRIRNRQPYGVELALLASLVLAGSSIPRAMRSQKPLPMGLSALALFGLWSFGVAWSKKL